MRQRLWLILFVCGCFFVLPAARSDQDTGRVTKRFPYQRAGLSDRQAAACLLSRFTYGARPGEVDKLLEEGIETWFENQLRAERSDEGLNQYLNKYDALDLGNDSILAIYRNPGQVLRLAIKEGVIAPDSVQKGDKSYRSDLMKYMSEKGWKAPQELQRQLVGQKVYRSIYSRNQLQEVMTSFWFNHFNVSATKNICALYIPSYERDVIRPNALGNFNDLLLATAKSPAMLYYLDNFSSVASAPSAKGGAKGRANRGLNENYARELMELHTLGVDGGYTQEDVTEAARVLTGWTVRPMGSYAMGKSASDRSGRRGFASEAFIIDGDFMFAERRHDQGVKNVMGHRFGPQAGYQEGVDLIHMLANHPSTAQFISRKLAVRFVSDEPPQQLVSTMAKEFTKTGGDIKAVLMVMVESPEFWKEALKADKTKSPFELVVGAVRNLNVEIDNPNQIYSWSNRMGEKLYAYQAPTGFPDIGTYWINTGALLNRMNFGLALASGKIPGAQVDLLALNRGHEPESAQAALAQYLSLILPDRVPAINVSRLEPLLTDPNLHEKVEQSASGAKLDSSMDWASSRKKNKGNTPKQPDMLAQVVGVILGSPEYQRR
ncbi:uncharacterized protein (DUF1800 family) [Dyadobacter jejuensis]|uniref:Uncharacterized protein (DUF1800 family) n=1 Tax=Dyadobacter jejuensis TaxID=1082580 RepID=A0A316AMB1_9BACT|nr:DUF1800 domain-containing protein [Dyadobacter jejuensis]PWJ58915.1 uncharacterized protein (DUF1800 family) [Dyadobacter jejuensis]